MNAPESPNELSDRQTVIRRVLHAPREVVFATLIDVEHISDWWGPVGFATTTSHHDVRPGGVWRFVMHGPDGTDYENRIVYHVVDPPRRLAYVHDDGDGEIAKPVCFENEFTLEPLPDDPNKTLLVMTATFPSAEVRQRVADEYGAIGGGMDTLTRLAEHMAATGVGGAVEPMVFARPNPQTILMRRVFDAPPDLVWRAWTDPAQIAKWWGPRGWTTKVEVDDFRPGGDWTYTMHGPNGEAHPVIGRYIAIDPPHSITTTIGFDPDFDYGWLPEELKTMTQITTFEAFEGRTRLLVRIEHHDAVSRQTHEDMGVVEGLGSSLDCLAELLADLSG